MNVSILSKSVWFWSNCKEKYSASATDQRLSAWSAWYYGLIVNPYIYINGSNSVKLSEWLAWYYGLIVNPDIYINDSNSVRLSGWSALYGGLIVVHIIISMVLTQWHCLSGRSCTADRLSVHIFISMVLTQWVFSPQHRLTTHDGLRETLDVGPQDIHQWIIPLTLQWFNSMFSKCDYIKQF